MIVKFSVENYKSIKDKLELDFRVDAHNKPNINKNPFVLKINDDYISKLCLFYGDNGAGKSNIINALYNLCLCPYNDNALNTLYTPHISRKDKESKFGLEFYSNKLSSSKKYSLFEYKICIKKENGRIIIADESLYKDRTPIFQRRRNIILRNTIVPNHKFMRELLPYNKPILAAFKSMYIKPEEQNKINKYLKLMQLLPSSKMPLDVYKFYNYMIKLVNDGIDDIYFRKDDDVGNIMAIDSISDGIKKYVRHMYNVTIALREGRLSLHDSFNGIQSDLVKTIFLLFAKNRYKEVKQTAQLFLTTHDIGLMDFAYLLLEQIMFVVKENNKTYVYSGAQIKGLNKDNLVKNYKENKLGGKHFPRAYDLPIKMFKMEK